MIYRKKLRILSIPINWHIPFEKNVYIKHIKVEIYLKLFNLHLQKQTRINFILKKEVDILSYYCNQSVYFTGMYGTYYVYLLQVQALIQSLKFWIAKVLK